MSGHSKWTQIKRQKAISDKKRGNVFTKLANTISLATKQGGRDPETNFKLRLAIEKARAANMPNENVERAIKRGSGELGGAMVEEAIYEGYGPGGIAIIIEAATDNKNRTTAAIRTLLTKHGGRLGGAGSVGWLFQRKGVIHVAANLVADKEALELSLIEAGADDIENETDGLTVISSPEALSAITEVLTQLKISAASAEVELIPQTKVSVTDSATTRQLGELFEELESLDEVSNYFTNADL